MNKELIKKYKAEFDYWINGGENQVYYKIDNAPRWWTDKESLDYYGDDNFSNIIENLLDPNDVLVVIDDEYVEFRKALAEGKTVQEQDYYSKQWVDMKTDDFHRASDTQYEGVYRIKPEEPKFKVGDWVVNKTLKQRIIKKVTSVYSDSVTVGDSTVGINVMSIEDLELWEPKPGEWCWFHNGISSSLVFAMFYNSNSFGYWIDEDESDIITNSEFYTYKYCEPFTGNLPTIILN